MGFKPYCSTIFTRVGEIAVPPCLAPSRLPSPYRHAFSWAHWTRRAVKPWDHLPPAIFCTRDAPCASQTGTITAALMKESYFHSHNVCNTTQEPLSDFSSTVVLNWFSLICGSIYWGKRCLLCLKYRCCEIRACPPLYLKRIVQTNMKIPLITFSPLCRSKATLFTSVKYKKRHNGQLLWWLCHFLKVESLIAWKIVVFLLLCSTEERKTNVF